MSKIARTVYLSLVVGLFASLAAVAQNRPGATGDIHDTIFDEIELTAEGVTATDTLGNRWRYDFETDQFVPDEEGRSRSPRFPEGGRGRETSAAPVEERCTDEQVIKPFQRSALVGYDEYVDGDIIAVGRVTVKGWVKGDIQTINGRVLVTESGQVDGDIKAPEIVVRPGGKVLGQQIISDPLIDFPTREFGRQFSVDGLIIALSLTAFFLLVGFIGLSLAPRQFGNMGRCLRQYPVRSTLMGVAMVFLLPIVFLVLAITIVGILLIPFLPLLMVIAAASGVVAFGTAIGQRLLRRWQTGEDGGLLQSLGGTILFMLLWVAVAILLGTGDEISQGFGIFFLVVAIIVSVHPVCGGIGSAVLTRFGGRPYASFRDRHQIHETGAPAPAPPPIPTAPPFVAPPPVPPIVPRSDVPPPLSSDSK
ncbi:MAG: polymer-forming cytoskeletal protein [Candidatus Zixiibacteriota bacterium]